jgi:serine/threonine-protein kinase
MLVQRAARQRRDLAGLQAFLLPEIATEEGRIAFMQVVAHIAATPPEVLRAPPGSSGARGGAAAPPPGTHTRFFRGSPADLGQSPGLTPEHTLSPNALTPTVLEHAQKVLTRRIGPIARVIVKKAASEVEDRESLYARLIENMDPAERAAVLEELRRGG